MPTILLTDDYLFCCELFTLAVERAGYKVLTANTGHDALKLLRAYPVDLLMLDLHMPGLDGLSTLRLIREDPKLRNLPVILLTAVEERESIKQAAALGIQGYILKSRFSLQDLLARIEKLVGPPGAAPLPATVQVVYGNV